MKKVTKNIGIYVIIFGLVLAMVWFYNSDAPKEEKEIKTSTMIHYLQDKKVESINVTETKMTAELNNGKTVYAYVNSAVDLSYIYDSYIMPQVDEGSLKLKRRAEEGIHLDQSAADADHDRHHGGVLHPHHEPEWRRRQGDVLWQEQSQAAEEQ